MAEYKVITKDSSGNYIAEFEKFLNLAWERHENDVGACRFKIPSNDDKLNITNALSLEAGSGKGSFIDIYRDSSLVWQGFISLLQDDVDGTTVFGLDFIECLSWYGVGYNTDYTAQKIGSQFLKVIMDAIALRTDSIFGSIITVAAVGDNFQDPYDTGTTTDKTITRTVFDEDALQIFKEMVAVSRADSPSGAWVQNTVFSITLEPDWATTKPELQFHRNVGSDKESVVFELDSEIVDFNFIEDIREVRNEIKGYAVEEGPKVLNSSQSDATSRTSYYRREYYPFYSSANNQTELDEKVKSLLKDAKDVNKVISLRLRENIAPFNGYVMGDNVNVRISRGRISLDEYLRVIGMEVAVDSSGSEVVKPLLQRKRT